MDFVASTSTLSDILNSDNTLALDKKNPTNTTQTLPLSGRRSSIYNGAERVQCKNLLKEGDEDIKDLLKLQKQMQEYFDRQTKQANVLRTSIESYKTLTPKKLKQIETTRKVGRVLIDLNYANSTDENKSPTTFNSNLIRKNSVEFTDSKLEKKKDPTVVSRLYQVSKQPLKPANLKNEENNLLKKNNLLGNSNKRSNNNNIKKKPPFGSNQPLKSIKVVDSSKSIKTTEISPPVKLHTHFLRKKSSSSTLVGENKLNSNSTLEEKITKKKLTRKGVEESMNKISCSKVKLRSSSQKLLGSKSQNSDIKEVSKKIVGKKITKKVNTSTKKLFEDNQSGDDFHKESTAEKRKNEEEKIGKIPNKEFKSKEGLLPNPFQVLGITKDALPEKIRTVEENKPYENIETGNNSLKSISKSEDNSTCSDVKEDNKFLSLIEIEKSKNLILQSLDELDLNKLKELENWLKANHALQE